MTHVWQHQHGRLLPAEALSQTLQNRFNYDAAYDYDLHSVRDFHALDLEQQAQFVEDYYVARPAVKMLRCVKGSSRRQACQSRRVYRRSEISPCRIRAGRVEWGGY